METDVEEIIGDFPTANGCEGIVESNIIGFWGLPNSGSSATAPPGGILFRTSKPNDEPARSGASKVCP